MMDDFNSILSNQIVKAMMADYSIALLQSIAHEYHIPYDQLLEYYGLLSTSINSNHNNIEKNNHDDEKLINHPFSNFSFEHNNNNINNNNNNHNHLPVRWLVPDCSHCQKLGNILKHNNNNNKITAPV
jgi:hypothetical protein